MKKEATQQVRQNRKCTLARLRMSPTTEWMCYRQSTKWNCETNYSDRSLWITEGNPWTRVFILYGQWGHDGEQRILVTPRIIWMEWLLSSPLLDFSGRNHLQFPLTFVVQHYNRRSDFEWWRREGRKKWMIRQNKQMDAKCCWREERRGRGRWVRGCVGRRNEAIERLTKGNTIILTTPTMKTRSIGVISEA